MPWLSYLDLSPRIILCVPAPDFAMNYSTDLEFHYDVLELLARRLRPNLYVGFGVASGRCLAKVRPHCLRTIGVDLKAEGELEGCELFRCSTSEFVERVLPDLPPIEMAFIDADHRYEAALADFRGLLPHLAPDGVILLHDTYPSDRRWVHEALCADCFRAADAIHRQCHALGVEIVTLPTPPGLSIARKRDRQLAWLEPTS